MIFFLSFCLSFFLSFFVFLSFCLSFFLSFFLSVFRCLSFCLSVFLSFLHQQIHFEGNVISKILIDIISLPPGCFNIAVQYLLVMTTTLIFTSKLKRLWACLIEENSAAVNVLFFFSFFFLMSDIKALELLPGNIELGYAFTDSVHQ